MAESRATIVAWVAREIVPHEAMVRAWLSRSGVPADDVEDVMQDAYCRFSSLAGVAHIGNARAYFFRTARSIVIDQLRRARVVRIETVGDLAAYDRAIDEPSPERVADAKRQLLRVRRLIADLPDRCRRVFEMRKIEGLPQREIARRLGVTETIVENDVVRGQRLILRALAKMDGTDADEEPGQTRGAARA